MDNFDDLLAEAKAAGASDIHITSNRSAYFRIDGKLQILKLCQQL